MIDDDQDLDAAAQRLRAAWAVDSRKPSALAPEDRAAAEKLLGKANAARLASRPRNGARPFRPTPVRTEFEWYWYRLGHFLHWRIEKFENRAKSTFAEGSDLSSLQSALNDARATGKPVREIRMGVDGMPAGKNSALANVSKRRQILNQFAAFASKRAR